MNTRVPPCHLQPPLWKLPWCQWLPVCHLLPRQEPPGWRALPTRGCRTCEPPPTRGLPACHPLPPRWAPPPGPSAASARTLEPATNIPTTMSAQATRFMFITTLPMRSSARCRVLSSSCDQSMAASPMFRRRSPSRRRAASLAQLLLVPLHDYIYVVSARTVSDFLVSYRYRLSFYRVASEGRSARRVMVEATVDRYPNKLGRNWLDRQVHGD